MLRAYKPINNDLYKVHQLFEYLVNDVWCAANNTPCKTKLSPELKKVFEKHPWFKQQVTVIYEICKRLPAREKNDFKNAFNINNRIEDLCNGHVQPISLNTLNADLINALRIFSEKLYTKFLGWKLISDKYGTKKAYYDALIDHNDFTECPCCGFGDIKTVYSKGYSPYDHYLPQKHYPFSVINFNNLVPLCHSCNSDHKGEKDILKAGQKVFYPFANDYPIIEVKASVDKSKLIDLISKIESNGNRLNRDTIKIDFNIVDERVESWDKIFDIRNRYFGKIADNRISWITDVRKKYQKDKDRISDYTFEKAFDDVIEADSDKHLGFLKSPYLKDLKSYNHLIKAMDEVSTHSRITR